MRVRKTVNGVATNYTYNGKMLAHMTKGLGSSFHYIHDLQGDIACIVDSNGNKVVEYYYDAWGRFAAGVYATGYLDLLQLNPFRYRGYVYDSETGLYYLQSRYYSCVLGRFISADVVLGEAGQIFGHNLFCYCGNDPIKRIDHFGTNWFTIALTGLGIAMVGLIALATIPFGGPLLAGLGISATTASLSANTAVATGLLVTTSSMYFAINDNSDKNYQKARSNKQANEWARQAGAENAESLKAEYVGSNGAKFNIFRNKNTGEIVLKAIRDGKEIITDYVLKW